VAQGAWALPGCCGASSYASSGCSRGRHSMQSLLRLKPRRRRNPNSLQRAMHSRHPPPLRPHHSASTRWTSHTRRWQCESRSDVGFSMSRSRWSTALGRGTYGGCVVGEDVQGLLRSLHRQVRRLLARGAASPNPDGRFEHSYTASTARRRDTLECTCCSEGGSALRVWV
jgi:hypothetical protein